MSADLKKKGIREFLLWHIFGLVPYWIRTVDKKIIFYVSVKNCQELDRYITVSLKKANTNAPSN